jgi:hypothetical protein
MTEELVTKGLEILNNSATLFTAEAEKTLAEYINLLMAMAVLDLIKTGLIVLAFFVAIRKLNILINAEKESGGKDKGLATGLSVTKNFLAIALAGYAIVGGISSIREIVKIAVAPRVYLLEKGGDIVKALPPKAMEKK